MVGGVQDPEASALPSKRTARRSEEALNAVAGRLPWLAADEGGINACADLRGMQSKLLQSIPSDRATDGRQGRKAENVQTN